MSKRDDKARSQKIQERQRVKRNASKRKNAHLSVEKLNHRRNAVEAKKSELIDLYMKEVVKQFESQQIK